MQPDDPTRKRRTVDPGACSQAFPTVATPAPGHAARHQRAGVRSRRSKAWGVSDGSPSGRAAFLSALARPPVANQLRRTDRRS